MNDELHVPGVTRAGLAALMERHGLGSLQTVEPLRGGEVNPMLLVNGAVVVRFNRRDPHLPKLAKEALIYRRLRRETEVPCPDVLALDTARDLVPYDTLMLSYIEGVQGSVIWPQLDLAAREQLSEALGRMCAAIHRLRWTVYGELVAGAEWGVRSARWTDVVLAQIERDYERALGHGLIPPRVLDGLVTTLNEGEAIFDTAEQPALTHTDLGLWNIVLREEGGMWRVAAILDWEWAITADPAWEFADLWSDPSDPYPLPDPFLTGYKERRPLPHELRPRRALYRLLHHFEMVNVCAAHFAATPERAQFHLAAIKRLLVIK